MKRGRRGLLGTVSAHDRTFKQISSIFRSFAGRLSVSVMLLLIFTFCLWSRFADDWLFSESKIDVDDLWRVRSSSGWHPLSAPSSDWKSTPPVKNGYLLVRCNGGLNQQRSAICNAVLAARIMNATLVLPDLDTNSFWNDKRYVYEQSNSLIRNNFIAPLPVIIAVMQTLYFSGFSGIYDVDYFIKYLKNDVEIVRTVPSFRTVGSKKKKLKPFQLRPPRDASPEWYQTVALEKMKEHGAIYLTPFSHRLAEEINNFEYQKLRCRVNFHALRFNKDILKLSQLIVNQLRSEGHFLAVHLRFEMDMLAFAGCIAIFTPEEQEILKKYRKENFAEKRLEYEERRMIGKCPLTPEEVGLILQSMGFNSSTRIYIAAGDIFGGERFMWPLRALFPRLVNRTSIATEEELKSVRAEGKGLLGPAVDYMVCLLADIFMPTYDGPSNFANNVMGHRLYYGFRTSIQPDRKALAPIFKEREKGNYRNFEGKVRLAMQHTPFGGPHPRVPPESFYTNPWPECFCRSMSESVKDRCPAGIANLTEHELYQVDDEEESLEVAPDDM